MNRFTGAVRPTLEIALAEEMEHMATRYQMIANELRHGLVHYICMTTGPRSFGGCTIGACTRDAFACPNVNAIFLCPGFWTGPSGTDSTLLIHETAHMIWERVFHGAAGSGTARLRDTTPRSSSSAATPTMVKAGLVGPPRRICCPMGLLSLRRAGRHRVGPGLRLRRRERALRGGSAAPGREGSRALRGDLPRPDSAHPRGGRPARRSRLRPARPGDRCGADAGCRAQPAWHGSRSPAHATTSRKMKL